MSMRDELDHLVFEMLTKGIRYDDAHKEFEKRFISHALRKVEGNVGQAAELLRANYLMRAVFVPAGEHLVEFRYDPLSFKLGIATSLVGCGLAALLIALQFRKEKRTQSVNA